MALPPVDIVIELPEPYAVKAKLVFVLSQATLAFSVPLLPQATDVY